MSVGAAVTWKGVKQHGIIKLLPPSTQKLLMQTTMIEWLTDTTMMEALKPYLLFCMGPTRQEQALLLRTVPTETRVALTQPGLLHCLPDSVQAMLLPAVTPLYDTVTAVHTSSNSSSSSDNRSNALRITQSASPERSSVRNSDCDVDYTAHSASVDSDDDTVVHGSGTGYASSCSSDDAAVQNNYDDVSDNVSTAANSPATVRCTARQQQQQQQQRVNRSNNSNSSNNINSSSSNNGNTAVRSSNTGANASVETHQSDSPANVEVDEPAVETSERVTLEVVARTMVQNRVKDVADSVVQGVLSCINGRVLSGTAVVTGTALAVQLCSSQRARKQAKAMLSVASIVVLGGVTLTAGGLAAVKAIASMSEQRTQQQQVQQTTTSEIITLDTCVETELEQSAPQRTARDLTKDVKLIAYIIALHGTATNSAVYAKLRQLLLAKTPLSKAAYVTAVLAVIAAAVRRAHHLKAAAKLSAVYGLQHHAHCGALLLATKASANALYICALVLQEQVLEAFESCFNLDEKLMSYGSPTGMPLGVSTSTDLRQTLAFIARSCNQAPLGMARFFIQDKEQMSGFVLDAESCKQQPDGTPLIEVRYMFNMKENVTAQKVQQINISMDKAKETHELCQ
eukprot:20719-Heterococcus_DN1.PRE.1